MSRNKSEEVQVNNCDIGRNNLGYDFLHTCREQNRPPRCRASSANRCGLHSARNGHLELPVYIFIGAKQGYTVRKLEKDIWI
jgi:hypothetical protein